MGLDSHRAFLLEKTDPSVRCFALTELFDRPLDDPEVVAARTAIGTDGWAAKILHDQAAGGHWERFDGDGRDLYVPKYIATNWRLIVLAELGMTRSDPRIVRSLDLLRKHWSGSDGSFGEPGSEVCITGNLARMMLRFGCEPESDPQLRASLDWLMGAQKADGGWHCFESTAGTLDGWEALAAFACVPSERRSPEMRRAIERGAEFYLSRGLLTESDGSTHGPWRRLHYPNHYYYDLLVGLDFLAALGYARDARLKPPLDLLESKRNPEGTWNLEGVHPDLEPGDGYHPSPPFYPFLVEHVDLPS